MIKEVSVFGDNDNEYSFEIAEQNLILGENENRYIEFKMTDYEQIEEKLAGEAGRDGEGNVVLSEEQIFETKLKGITMRGTGELFYDVEHKGSGKGFMQMSGYATGDYDVVVKIVKGGVVGEAIYEISLDGGRSFIGRDTVADSCKIDDAGLALYFSTELDTDEFIEGDEYRGNVLETFPTIASKVNTANIVVAGHPMQDHDLTVEILSSGGFGKSRFTINSTKGEMIQVTDVMPKNGKYALSDGITLNFSKSEEYEKGLIYTVTIRSNDDTTDYTPVYILIGIAVCGVIAGYYLMAGKREKESDYHIRRYVWKQGEQEHDDR